MLDPNIAFLRKSGLIVLTILMVLPAIFLYYEYTHVSTVVEKISVEKNIKKRYEDIRVDLLLPIPGTVRKIILNKKGDRAYVASFGQGVHILDLSTPMHPKVVTQFKYGLAYDSAVDIILSKDEKTLYVLDMKHGLYSLNVRDVTAPKLLSYVKCEGAEHLSLSLDEHRIYVSGKFGVLIIDNANTMNLVGRLHYLPDLHKYVVGRYKPYLQYAGFEVITDMFEVENNILYLMSQTPDIVDISNLLDIKMITRFSILGNAKQVTVSKNRQRLYIASGHSGIEIFEIADYRHPKPLGGHNTKGLAINSTISKDGKILFVSNLNRGVELFDITYPYDPKFVTSIEKPPVKKGQVHATALSPDNNVLYIAYGVIGLGVVDLSPHK